MRCTNILKITNNSNFLPPTTGLVMTNVNMLSLWHAKSMIRLDSWDRLSMQVNSINSNKACTQTEMGASYYFGPTFFSSFLLARRCICAIHLCKSTPLQCLDISLPTLSVRGTLHTCCRAPNNTIPHLFKFGSLKISRIKTFNKITCNEQT